MVPLPLALDDAVKAWLTEHGIHILLVLMVAAAVSWVGGISVRRVRRRLEAATSATQEIRLQRAATVAHTLTNAIRIAVWTAAVLLILGQLDVNLGPLLAGAGVAGVALGFGAQSLVRDFLAGFFILFENQFDVGDRIEITVAALKFSGEVTRVTLRRTELRDADGALHVIPNGNIQLVTNRSEGVGRLSVEVTVPQDTDLERTRDVLEELLQELRNDHRVRRSLFAGPSIDRVERTSADVRLEIIAETRPEKRAELEHVLRSRISQRLDPDNPEIQIA